MLIFDERFGVACVLDATGKTLRAEFEDNRFAINPSFDLAVLVQNDTDDVPELYENEAR